MESVSEEIVGEILLKLPTRDIARCRCISRQWCRILTDPSYIDLHVPAVSGDAEALLVSQTRPRGRSMQTIVYSVFSAKPMCRVTDLEKGYRLTNACNGFLLLAQHSKDSPLFVCNPVTGEKLEIPAPPNIISTHSHTYAMGFCPSTGQYKLLHLSSVEPAWWHIQWDSYLEVYTLGNKGAGVWRQHRHMLPHRALHGRHMPPPALVDGKIYLLTERRESNGTPDRMLVIDMASETRYTYPLPEEFKALVKAAVHPFEMCGRLCLAVRMLGQQLLHFWFLAPMHGHMLEDTNEEILHGRWELGYTFYMDDTGSGGRDVCQSGAWLDARDGMLCYKWGDRLYKYNITKEKEHQQEAKDGGFSRWDFQIQLPAAPYSDNPGCHDKRWNVFGGYRPSLLSPHHLTSRRNVDEQEQYELALAHALRCNQLPEKQCSTCPPHQDNCLVRASKRVRYPITAN